MSTGIYYWKLDDESLDETKILLKVILDYILKQVIFQTTIPNTNQ